MEDLQRSIADINQNPSIGFVVVTGDLTESGDRASIQAIKDALDQLNVPYYAASGNHETTWSESGVMDFSRVFGDSRFAFSHDGMFFIGFNSGPVIRMADGHVAPQDIAWLKHNLDSVSKAGDAPIFVFTHYPLRNGDVDNWYDVSDVLREHNVQCLMGGHYHRNLLFDCDGNIYSYYTGKTIEEIENTNYLPLIPSLVDMDDVAMARSLFVGKQLYILTNHWYNLQGEVIEGRHLVAVSITNVEPGNNVLPLAIHFIDQRGIEAQVYITTKSSANTQMLSFDRLFAYKNPRDEHSDIGDEVWLAITESRLLKGMTKNECRLSIGLPAEVNKIPTYNGLKEQWLYNSGAYLFFSDGILEEFRQ
jgi:3',5'-cyclic AMP phosphodiesterase CpdA